MQWLAAATAVTCHHPCQRANVLKSFRRMASLLLYRQNRGGAARKTCAGDSAEWANHIMNTCGGGGDGIKMISRTAICETIGEGCGDPADRANRTHRHAGRVPPIHAVPHAVPPGHHVVRHHAEHRLRRERREVRRRVRRARIVREHHQPRHHEERSGSAREERSLRPPRHARATEVDGHVVQMRPGGGQERADHGCELPRPVRPGVMI